VEETCPSCGAWGTHHTFDDEGDDVLVRPEPRAEAAARIADISVALVEVKYRLRNVYTGETVSEEAVCKASGLPALTPP